VLEGHLGDFTLPDILRLLSFTAKSGRLVMRADHAAGRIDLVDGRIRDASADADRLPLARRLLGGGLVTGGDLRGALEGRSELPTDLEFARGLVSAGVLDAGSLAEVLREQTVDAVFDLLRWTDGSFRFDGFAVQRDGSLSELAASVDEVLEEATRRLDAWANIAERTGADSSVVTISRPTRDREEVALPPDGWGLLSLVDGRRTVLDLVRLSGQGQYRTRRTLGALLDEGVVTVGATGGPGQVEKLVADHRALAAIESRLDPVASNAVPAPEAPAPTPDTRPSTDGRTPADPVDAPATEHDRASDAGTSDPVSEQVTAPDAEQEAAPMTAETTEEDPNDAAVTPLRAKVRSERLRTDPSVDADLVKRLIDGVEGL
jgi:hypothetical protein